MKANRKIKDIGAAALLVASVVLFIMSIGRFGGSGDTAAAARRATRVIESRMAKLDGYMEKALSQDCVQWLDLGKLPQDMVVYRYCRDSLQSWCNEFPIANDNINVGTYVPFVSNPRLFLISPLTYVTDSVSFVNMGPKWYLAKSASAGEHRVIAGLEIVNMQSLGAGRGINRHLRLGEEFAIRPLSSDGGSVVEIDGRPQFEIVCESLVSSGAGNSMFLWVALALFIISSLVFLAADKTVRRLRIVLASLFVVMFAMFLLGSSIRGQFAMFSPVLYAGNGILYSLGAVVIMNLAILVFSLCVYMTREDLCLKLKTRTAKATFLSVELLAVAGILLNTFVVMRSIALNSGISLELYRLSELTSFCLVVYASFITMLMSVPLIMQTVQPIVKDLFGIRYDAFSTANRIAFAVIISAYLVTTSGVLGFKKEKGRMEVLAKRLSFDRDISLELRLRSMESQIADDMIISGLSVLNNTASSIQRRIVDNYFARDEQDYSVSVHVFNGSNNTRAASAQYNALVKDGVPIADNSRFMFVKKDNSHSYYLGVFLYLIEDVGISRVLVRVESRDVRGSKGYAGILGINPPGKVSVPPGYSYARYDGYDLKFSKGNFAYPTRLEPSVYSAIYEEDDRVMLIDGYAHFITEVGGGELVMISRAKVTVVTYIVTGIFVALLAFLMMSLLTLGRKKEKIFAQSYYRSRIVGVLLISLILTLVAMALVSVLFVYSRNDMNMRTVMSDKISSINSMVEAGISEVPVRPEGINRGAMRRLIERVGDNTNSDITVYTTSGRLMMSTVPVVFDRQFLGERINGEAYRAIMYEHARYCIQQETLGRVRFYSMYAPVIGEDGRIVAIICSPYNEDDYDFEEDAVTHSLTIVSLFVVFLMAALFIVSGVVDRMFRPLSEMSRKMDSADLETLEYIDYDRDDEISSIVQAYNRMVSELSESSRKLVMAERDKAWSEMARQVAHEIKNPLTPMKLQIQMLMRLKQRNDPSWQARFDEAGKVLIDHIDILTDTANEFSTFAKLYTEEPTEIDLDRLIQEEISMFDNRDNIVFDYFGLEGVKVMGPKPQLTRVFVNLINNSVQAIADKPDGRIIVFLRNSMRDGYYDIVFEDNGPGVTEENEKMLFTPNFTTKSGGSGLGLAISRSILEKCGATISYKRSYTIGGACFTICYPKNLP